MNETQRQDLVLLRKVNQLPWHSPPHRVGNSLRYHITAACFEHRCIIGFTPERMADFEAMLLQTISSVAAQVYAWVVLPNHYHVLIKTNSIERLLTTMGRNHGRTSYRWNGEENCRGRQVWFNALEHCLKSERHFWATMNYIHHNPVRHGYVRKWRDWPYSSGSRYLEAMGEQRAQLIWKEYPVDKMGDEWDPPDV